MGVIRSLTFSRPSHIYSCASLPFLRPSPVYYRRICHFLPFLSFWFHSFERRRRWESCPDIQLVSLSLSLQVCLVGKSRNYQLPDEAEAEQRRAHYVESRQTASGITGQRSDIRRDGESCHENRDNDRTPGSSWGAGFQPRDRVETVRNCASLPRDFVDGVVLRVANVLLGMTEDDGSDWNRGGKPPPATKHQR